MRSKVAGENVSNYTCEPAQNNYVQIFWTSYSKNTFCKSQDFPQPGINVLLRRYFLTFRVHETVIWSSILLGKALRLAGRLKTKKQFTAFDMWSNKRKKINNFCSYCILRESFRIKNEIFGQKLKRIPVLTAWRIQAERWI